MIKNLYFLAISASSNSDVFTKADNADEPKKIAIWIVVLIAVTLACTFGARYVPEIKKAIKSRVAEGKMKKIESDRQEELDRLHKIKEKNKRK